jgi:hypothetical protein
MKTFELKTINGRKSFYGKCRVVRTTNISTLLSYETEVAEYYHKTNEMKITKDKNLLTKTTLTHIRAFLEFYGFDPMTKKQILNS